LPRTNHLLPTLLESCLSLTPNPYLFLTPEPCLFLTL